MARFVVRLHRRLVVLRAVESAALGVLLACIAAIILLPILLYRSQPDMPLVMLLLPLGGGCGLLWMLLHRPTALNATIQADTQLQLADLLSTAWSLRHRTGRDPVLDAVRAAANARCANLSPGSIVLARLGVRAWGGIGLATALVLTLGLIGANPLQSQASSSTSPLNQDRPSLRLTPSPAPTFASADNPRPPAAIASDDPTEPDSAMDLSPPALSASAANPPNSASADTVANPEGGGSGSGRSQSDPDNTAQPSFATDASRSGAGTLQPAGGGSAGATDPRAATGPSGAGTSDGSSHPPAAPWTSASWPIAVQSADAAIRAGRISADYQDLVRGYFER